VFWEDILHGRQAAYFKTIRDKTNADAPRAFIMSALSDAAAYRKTADSGWIGGDLRTGPRPY
jgi:hypothetical protein